MAEQFLSLVVTMLPALKNIERRLDRETGRRFNVFENLFAIDEAATSRILSFLLDPTEAHGQNDVFLRAFIRQFVPEWRGTFNFSKARRSSTRELIDVVISDGSHWLGIENKIFNAPEQKRQAGRYLEALQDAPHQENYRLIYLSPKGKGPSDYSLFPKDKERHGANLVCGAWAQSSQSSEDDEEAPVLATSILDWLTECRNQCRAESVSWVLRQFYDYVESVIAGQKEADMADAAIVGLALRDPQNLDAALRIGENYLEIKRNVIRKFLQFIHNGLQEWAKNRVEDWEVIATWPAGNWIDNPDKRYLSILLRKKSWPAMVGSGISADQNGPWQVFIGISGPTREIWMKQGDAKNTIFYGEQASFIGQESRQNIINTISPPGEQSDWWVYYEKCLTDPTGQLIWDWRDSKTVIRLNSERVALGKFIIGRITSLASSISGLVIDAS